jgi:2-dehydro-3-deoxygluconokinase
MQRLRTHPWPFDGRAVSTAPLTLRGDDQCRFELLSLGEVMLRLDPGEGRIRTARDFHAWEGGGEYNVARGLRRCFGLRTAVLTALVDNEIGRLIEDLIFTGGVDPSLIVWVPSDGIGAKARNGLNFTERGFGVRAALGASDRGNTAASHLTVADVDLHQILVVDGVRWLHTGGIFAGLSPASTQLALDAMQAARASGTIVSYDLNYRPSLWAGRGGKDAAREVNRRLLESVDVLFGNEEDFEASLGITVNGVPELNEPDPERYERVLAAVASEFPSLKVLASTLRTVRSASRNDWAAIAWSAPTGYLRSVHRADLEVLDRVGGGDSFAAGLIYGLMAERDLQVGVDLGAAHGALVLTTPGDTSMASLDEVRSLAAGGNARIVR